MSTTRLHIDWTACDGRGLCAELLPELLTEDDWGYPVARTGEAEPAVPRQLEGVDRCPARALRLVTSPAGGSPRTSGRGPASR